uniref:Bromo domain-containing protein n=1 Tax=Rhabditophanes sp. KR3021 TaxID=114890 RepID=A0AC35TFR1_9BILA
MVVDAHVSTALPPDDVVIKDEVEVLDGQLNEVEVPPEEVIEYDANFGEPQDPISKFEFPENAAEQYPLREILHPDLIDIDPKSLFPDFERNQILRFGRLMQPLMKETSKMEIWWPSKSFYKKQVNKAKTKVHQTEPIASTSTQLTSDDVVVDDLYLLRMPIDASGKAKKNNDGSDEEEESTPWRNGPSKVWFDQVNLPNNTSVEELYEKVKKTMAGPSSKNSVTLSREAVEKERKLIADLNNEPIQKWSKYMNYKALIPVNLMNWENDVVFNENQARDLFLKKYGKDKAPASGWLPTAKTKTYEDWVTFTRQNPIKNLIEKDPIQKIDILALNKLGGPDEKVSMFPLENNEWDNSKWEDDIIWDPENLDKMPEPKVLTIDFKDDPRAYGMPQDTVDVAADGNTTAIPEPLQPKSEKAANTATRKSKMILGQVQQRQKQEEEEQMENTMARFNDKDPFNLSNDDYYCATGAVKAGIAAGISNLVQHSIPAQNVSTIFFPTHLTAERLRMHHRVPLHGLSRKFLRTLNHGQFISIRGLTKLIQKREEERQKIKTAEGGGDYFFMREHKDLTGMDGSLCMFEYLEEHPPLLNQPGMASKIKNYHRRKPGVDSEPTFEFGSLTYTHSSPFLGSIPPGTTVQSLENNMFKAPIYQHTPKVTDFLLIRTKEGFFVRKHPALFVVGQENPTFEVPSPNSKTATNFVRDFLMAFIYRLFWNSPEDPKRIKIDEIKAAFPHQAESSIRKRLKVCSDFKRFDRGNDQNYWVLRDDFRLPSKEEVMAMVTPEMCCVQYSMLAEEQRLQDAGYRVKNNMVAENKDNDSDDDVTLEDEQKCAAWNTTRAFINFQKGKCLLDNTGIADPTGKGLGFSFVRVSAKPPKEAKKEENTGPKKLVTGTNADLRKLPLKEAKMICKGYGLTDEELGSLSRWDIIDVIRTFSTNNAAKKTETGELSRFARGNVRFNYADMQEKFKETCQIIWNKQSEMLADVEELATDNEESGDESGADENEKELQERVNNGEISKMEMKKIEYEREEKERLELQRMIHGKDLINNEKDEDGKKKKKDKTDDEWCSKKLTIVRLCKDANGKEIRRTETVSDPEVIKVYIGIKTKKDNHFIKMYAEQDEDFKEEKRREKRRNQDAIRRKKNADKKPLKAEAKRQKMEIERKPIIPKAIQLKLTCSSCGETGHMKTNKDCPKYSERLAMRSSEVKIGDLVRPMDYDMMDEDSQMSGNDSIKLDGFKMTISKSIVSKNNKPKLKMSIPKLFLSKEKLGDLSRLNSGSYLDDTNDSHSEMTDFSVDTDGNLNDGETDEGTSVKRGPGRPPLNATLLKRKAMGDTEYLVKRPKNVHRRITDPKVSMAKIWTEIFNDIKTIEFSNDFNKPVNEKKVVDYYNVVKNPIDLQTIKKKIDSHFYDLRRTFLEDFKLLYDNAALYNGAASAIAMTAKKMYDMAVEKCREDDNERRLIELEKQIDPLLDENDIVGFSYILGDVIQKCKCVPKSAAFHVPVDRNKHPAYYCMISNPIHLGILEQNVAKKMYNTVDHFLGDVRLMYSNSQAFNGTSHDLTAKAMEIVQHALKEMRQKQASLQELETNIRNQLFKEGKVIPESSFFVSQQHEELLKETNRIASASSIKMSAGEFADISSAEESNMSMEGISFGNSPDLGDQTSPMATTFSSHQLHEDLALSDSDDDDSD